jgi:hypothetical protein
MSYIGSLEKEEKPISPLKKNIILISLLVILIGLAILTSGCSRECYENKTESVKKFCRNNNTYGSATTDCVEKLLSNDKYEYNKCQD